MYINFLKLLLIQSIVTLFGKLLNILTKYINVFKAFFSATASAVLVNGELTRWFDVDSGTGQGDVQGPPIFNLVLNWGLEHKVKIQL